jgi:hypothetical protein
MKAQNLLSFPRPLLLLLVTAVLAACSTISPYDQTAYSQTVDAKVDALALMDKATGSYDSHRQEITDVTLEMDKAYEYEKGRALNQLTISQWDILLSPDHDLFGGFLKMWQQKGTLSPFFIAAKKKQVANGFDQIIQLEAAKHR